MITESLIKEPEGGARIVSGEPTPDNPIIPFIEGDGIGVDITPVMQAVGDAAVEKAYGGGGEDPLMEDYAGGKATPLFRHDVSLAPQAPPADAPDPGPAKGAH